MATFDTEYTSYYDRFKNNTFGTDFKYDPEKFPEIVDNLTTQWKQKGEENLKNSLTTKNTALTKDQTKIVTKTSTSEYKLLDEDKIGGPITRDQIMQIPDKVNELVEELLKSLNTEKEIIEIYNAKQYMSFIKDKIPFFERYITGDLQNQCPGTKEENDMLEKYKKYKKLLEDKDNDVYKDKLKESKLFKKAIQASVDKKNAAAKSTARRASSTVSAGSATTQLRATTTIPEMEELKKELTAPKEEVKVENPVYPGTEKMFENTTTEDTTKQTQKETNQIKTDPISTTKTTSTITSGVTGTVAQGVASTIKSAASSSVVKGVVNGAKDAMDKAGDAVTSIGKGVSGALNSAVTAIKSGATGNGNPLKITRLNRNNVDMQVNKGNAFIPPIAGIATAGAAGLGTKVYMDSAKKRKDNKEEEKSSGNKFFDYDKFDDDTTSYLDNSGEAQSKDDILSNIEQKY